MRVLVFTSMFPHAKNPIRGVAVYQRTLALAKRCELRVVSPQAFGGVAERETIAGIEVRRPRWRRLPKIGVLLDGYLLAAFSRRTVEEVAAAFDFDLIDTHWVYPDGFAAARLGRRLRKPVVLTARGTDVNDFCFRWPLRDFAREALRGATRLVAVSHALKQRMAETGVPAERITVIHNGVDTSAFRPADREEARGALGIPDGETVLFSAGDLLETKGFQHLIAGLALAPPNSQGRLHVAGEGPYRQALERLAAEKGLSGRVRLLGRLGREELARWYQAADFFCFGSLREGCPNVVIEALACGTPVVSARVGAAPELIEEGRTGLLFEPGSPEGFARALGDALARPWDREAIAAAGSRRSWDQVAREYCSVFEEAKAAFSPP
jgi:glycosyltransferase involved in cell wall biosynthesis